MKNHMMKALIGLVFMMSCSKANEDPELSVGLEQRGNDNHKIWNLARIDKHYTYSLTNGAEGIGETQRAYEYSCVRPFGRAVTFSDHTAEDGAVLWDNSSTMTYNDNFNIAVERAQEYGDEVVRTFHYDSDFNWTGITTEINGEVLDEEIEIAPGGQVRRYTSNGVRYDYTWRANNTSMVKIYVQPSAALSVVQKSMVFNQLGVNEISRKATRAHLLKSFKELQQLRKNSTSFRSNGTDEWVLIGIEEHTVDRNVIEPYSSPAKGYPGTTSDAGLYTLSKNWTVNYKAYRISEDGTSKKEYFTFNYHSYTVKDNLPVDTHYSYFIAEYDVDEAGNPIDYHEKGTEHYGYISGCNQKAN